MNEWGLSLWQLLILVYFETSLALLNNTSGVSLLYTTSENIASNTSYIFSLFLFPHSLSLSTQVFSAIMFPSWSYFIPLTWFLLHREQFEGRVLIHKQTCFDLERPKSNRSFLRLRTHKTLKAQRQYIHWKANLENYSRL